MARIPRPQPITSLSLAAGTVAVLLAGLALAAEPAREALVTFTFAEPAKERAKLTVTPGEAGTKAAAFKIVAGASSQVFSRANPGPRAIDVPADPRA